MANPNDINESFPSPTSGTGTPQYVGITGSGVSAINARVAKATLSKGSNSSVQIALTATLYDAAGNTSTGGTVNWKAYAAGSTALSTPDPNGVTESYPTGATFQGCVVNSSGVVTAYAQGVYIIEAEVVANQVGGGAIDSSANTKSSIAYGQLVLTVGA